MRNFLFIIVLFSFNVHAQTDIKVMFYNLLHFPSAPPSDRDVILKEILNGYEPDIFLVCELETQAAANTILNVSLSEINKNYLMAQHVPNQSSNSSILEQLVYFNSNYFTLIAQNVITTTYRDINHYTFRLNTADSDTNPKFLEIFVTHLKAHQGADNVQLRADMIDEFVGTLNNLNSNSFVLFAGDFNFYTSEELGYQKIINTNNNIIIKDLQNLNNDVQNWHNNINYQHLHTQSTRTSNVDFDGEGAGGGMDDQFDFIMLSENLLSNASIHYKPNTYDSYGSNHNCFNDRIDNPDCNGLYSANLRDLLYNMSDHLPVVLELETNETLTINDVVLLKNIFQFKNGNIINNNLNITVNEILLHQKIIIYNTLGQKVISKKITNTEMNINISNIKNAVYFIKVEGYNEVLKFIKH